MKREQRGLSLMEILIALALMALIVVSSLLVLQWALRSSILQQHRCQAAQEAAFLTEKLWGETSLSSNASGKLHGFDWSSKAVQRDDLMELTVHIWEGQTEVFSLKSHRRALRPRLVYTSIRENGETEMLTQEADSRRARPMNTMEGASLKELDGKKQLWVNGRLLPLSQDCLEPTLSPDEKKVAFTGQESGFSQIFVVDAKSGSAENISRTNHHDTSPGWSPDSKALVWIRDGSQLMLQRDRRQELVIENTGGWLSCPSFGPDGRSVVMMSNESGNPDIYLLELSSKRKKQLTIDAGYDSEPKISPDGRKIVFISNRSGRAAVFTMNLDGTMQRPLSGPGSASDRNNHGPNWR